MMTNPSKACFFLLSAVGAALLALPSPAAATSVVLGSDADLADQAAVVAEATVLGRSPAPLSPGLPKTDYSLRVERLLKGRVGAGTLLLRVLGGDAPNGLTLKVWGSPALQGGERLLLFLVPPKDGAYRPLHLAVGVFHLQPGPGGRLLAVRDLSEMELAAPGGGLTPGTVQARDFERFAQWLGDRAAGLVRAPDYRLELPAPAVELAREKFTYLNNLEQRWFEFDRGVTVHWTMSQAGQPGLDDGGFGEFQVAINVWNSNPGTNIKYQYDGTSNYSGGFSQPDGHNTLLTEDPNDDLPGSFTCSSPGVGSGILAAGGTYIMRGAAPPIPIQEADIVTQDGVGCWFNHNPALAAQIFAHELGHSLGLGHSCGDGLSGPCDSAAKSDALMRATAHNDNRGAAIRQDDRAGIATLYGSGTGGPPGGSAPAAPSGLTATVLSTTEIGLAWTDNSTDANQIEIESEAAGGRFRQVQALPGDAASFDATGLAPGTAYSFRLRARNAAGPSAYSNVATATTQADIAPLAPSDLSAAAQPGGRVVLSWQRGSSDVATCRIEQSSPSAGFARLAVLPGSSTSFTVTGLLPAMPYSFRVLARNSAGNSPPSNVASATALGSGPAGACVTAADTLCLRRGRFQVKVQWRNEATGEHGAGQMIPDSDQSGMFWFFQPSAVELIVKVIDGRGLNGFFWTFYGGLSDVEYWITVADTRTGHSQTYLNPSGSLCGAADTASLPAGDLASDSTPGSAPSLELTPLRTGGSVRASGPVSVRGSVSAGGPGSAGDLGSAVEEGRATCGGAAGRLCLFGGRFAVEANWTNTANGATGTGGAVPLSDQTGLFWFFDSSDVELVVKVIDGRPVNGRFWFFYGALSNVQYELRVTDTTSGILRTYRNAAGNLCGLGDTGAF